MTRLNYINLATYLFEYREIDLGDYFKSKTPPVTPWATKSFWSNICGLLEALQQLHEVSNLETANENGAKLVGYDYSDSLGASSVTFLAIS